MASLLKIIGGCIIAAALICFLAGAIQGNAVLIGIGIGGSVQGLLVVGFGHLLDNTSQMARASSRTAARRLDWTMDNDNLTTAEREAIEAMKRGVSE